MGFDDIKSQNYEILNESDKNNDLIFSDEMVLILEK